MWNNKKEDIDRALDGEQPKPTTTPLERKNQPLARFHQARKKLQQIKMDSQGQIGKRQYTYCSLSHLIEKAVDILEFHGLSFYQSFGTLPDGKNVIRTYIVDLMNENKSASIEEQSLISSSFILRDCPTHKDMTGTEIFDIKEDKINKALGQLITYARRYSLFAVFNIYLDQDNDGAMSPPKTPPQTTQTKSYPPKRTQYNNQRPTRTAPPPANRQNRDTGPPPAARHYQEDPY